MKALSMITAALVLCCGSGCTQYRPVSVSDVARNPNQITGKRIRYRANATGRRHTADVAWVNFPWVGTKNTARLDLRGKSVVEVREPAVGQTILLIGLVTTLTAMAVWGAMFDIAM